MTKQTINVGVEGNDATGDAIREAFQKTNENFNELYSAIGQGDGIAFTSLTDAPEELEPAKFLGTNDLGNAIIHKSIEAGDGIQINSTENVLTIINTGTSLSSDPQPALGGHLNANTFSLTNISEPTQLVADFLGVAVDTFAIPKGYADNRYVAKAGSSMTGALEVPAGATGSQVPRSSEVIKKAGDTMTGPLILDSDPTETSNPLTAASKNYVDTSSFSSQVNIYVSSNGSDYRPDVIQSKVGRALAYAFKTINRAAQFAEQIIADADVDLGPYEKPIYYGTGAARSTISSVTLVSGNTYTLVISNDGNPSDPRAGTNYDIRAGNLLKGESSGAIAKIASIGTVTGSTESYTVEYINDKTFTTGEYLSYGSSLKKPNISILVESGTYEEHLPIKVPENVSIVGDDMRRVIVKPKPGPSASKWAGLRFRRDTIFDSDSQIEPVSYKTLSGVTISGTAGTGNFSCTATTGLAVGQTVIIEGVNSGTGTISGYSSPSNYLISATNGTSTFTLTTLSGTGISTSSINGGTFTGLTFYVGQANGYHYLTDSASELYTKTITNAGDFPIAQTALRANRDFIQEEVIGFINTTYPSLSYDQTLCRRDVGLILDCIEHDLLYGGYSKSLEAGISYYSNASALIAITTQKTETLAAINHAKTLALRIIDKLPLSNSPEITSYQLTYTQDTSGDASEGGASVAVDDLMTLIYDIINEDTSFNMPKNNNDVDVFLLNNATILTFMTFQGHGGFAGVLDPEGQIITKSPYVHNCVSFTRSINQQIFAGGLLVDGFAGNLECTITTRTSSTELIVSGLNFREPQTPCAFYYQGKRFLVDYAGNYNSGTGTATLYLNPGTPDTNAYHGLGSSVLIAGVDLELVTAGNRSMVTNNFTQINDLGYGIVAANNGLLEAVSVFTYYCHAAYFATSGGQIRSLNGSSAYGNVALKAEGADPTELPDSVNLVYDMVQVGAAYTTVTYTNSSSSTAVYVDGLTYAPLNVSELEIDHSGTIVRYEISTATLEIDNGSVATNVYKLSLSSTGNNNTATTGLYATLSDNTPVIIRVGQNHLFTNVSNTNPIRPSTSLQFASDDIVYRAIAFSTAGLTSGQALVTTRETYNYSGMVLHSTAGTAGSGSGVVGDGVMRITNLSVNDAANIVGKKFGWGGTLHTVTSYQSTLITGQAYAKVFFTPNLTATTNGYGSPDTTTIRAGLPANFGAEITVRISSMRATGHDMLDIGTGSVADTNFPNTIFGEPNIPLEQASEVVEVGKGRVFFVTTDQYGNFRVGDYFQVDQGTGTVTFAATIALSNLDGIGFKRGVTISEFSIDDAMTDNATDSVPTEAATRGYIDRRLGLTHVGGAATSVIGPGFLARDGSLSATGDINFGGNKIINIDTPLSNNHGANKAYVDGVLTNAGTTRTGVLGFTMATSTSGQIDMNSNKITSLATPTNSSDAATKAYVDQYITSIDGIGGITLTTPASANLLAFTGTSDNAVNAAISGDITLSLASNTLTATISNSAITNSKVSATAGIVQSKLSLNDATAAATVGAATKGISAYSSTNFDTASGFVSIKSGGISLSNIANITSGTVVGNNSGLGAAPSELSFATVVQNGGALYNGLFSSNGAIVRTGINTYGTVSYVTTATNDTIVLRDASAGITANIVSTTQLNVDGNKTLDTSGTAASQTLEVYTPQGALALTAIGSSGSASIAVSSGNELRFNNTGNTFYVGFKAGTLSANRIWTLPTTDGTANQLLRTDGAGNLSWTSPTALGVTSVSGTGTVNGLTLTGTVTSTGSLTLGGTLDLSSPPAIGGTTAAAGTFTSVSATTVNTGDVNKTGTDGTGNLGQSGNRFGTVFTRALSTGLAATTGTVTGTWTLTASSSFEATYADLAEYYEGDQTYDVGTVLMLGGDKEVTLARGEGTRKVAGVVSNTAAYTMNKSCPGFTNLIALQGRVPVKVVGKISKGDMLVVSMVPGVAMASSDPLTGSIIGKALQDFDSDRIGTIEVMVGRH